VKKLFVSTLLFFPFILICQELHYINYDTKDGLAGSTVYSVCQDKDGFMWFATENGLSRFDGTHFKNFTVKDGLPDNEVLVVYPDRKGRIWIGTFSNQVCYYFEGKIYNVRNNELIKKINSTRNFETVTEDKNGYLGLGFRESIVIITPSDSVIKYPINTIGDKQGVEGTIFNFFDEIRISVSTSYEDTRYISVYKFDSPALGWVRKYGFSAQKDLKDSTLVTVKIDSNTNQHTQIVVPGKGYSYQTKNGIGVFVSTTDGSWSIDSNTLQLDKHFLLGKKVSNTTADAEKNIWFTTLGEGIFKLPSQAVQTIVNTDAKGIEIFSVINYQNKILAGGEFSQAIVVDDKLNNKLLDFSNNLSYVKRPVAGTNRLYSSTYISDSTVILGFDGFLVKLENGKLLFKYLSPLKSVCKIDKDFILAGTSFYTFKLRLSDLEIVDTIWRERCTKVFYKDHRYYIGTLRGLFEINEDKNYTYLGNLHSALTRRITDIRTDYDGLMWVSTSDDGLVALKKNEVVYHISEDNGLTSNICRTIFIDSSAVWVGTNKGINKISFKEGNYKITQYSTSDGLPSNTINALYFQKGRLWIGSPAGLSFFDEESISSSSICNLKILSVSVSGQKINTDSIHEVSFKNNNIRFEFSGISFRSGNEITYWYKLRGLNNEWKQTQENSLEFNPLPPGDYKFELYAINKYGVKSKMFEYDFSVTTPFWKTTWFYLVLLTIIFSLIIFFVNRRNKQKTLRLEQTNRFQKQFAALEQQALQSQMNPHFIFNCLNSIQQYILTNDTEKTNLYLTKFSSLIRQTLDISAQKQISVAEEISYLKKYLDMELMRFGDSFEYGIRTENIADPASMHIPALLLQPFVENSIRHGIRFKEDGKGKIDIVFSLQDNTLFCQIKDNGIGREKALVFKSRQHIEYQSRGIALTTKRINLLNSVNEKKISIAIIDLKDDNNNATGTSIEITMPI